VGDTGFEQPPKTSGKTAISARGGAESDAIGAPGDAIDADLRAIIEAWPGLPKPKRRKVLAMVLGASECCS